MLIVVVAGGIAVLISSLFSNKAAKISLIVTGVLFLASFIALVVVVWKYYNIHFEEFKEMYPGMSLVGMVVSAVVILAVLVVLWFVGDKRKLNDTRSIVYGAVAMALAFVLSYARLFKLPNGGSITFASLLPLMITAVCSAREEVLSFAVFTACCKRFKTPTSFTRCNFCSTILSHSDLSA